jgi:ATP-binding cassette subfamily B protein
MQKSENGQIKTLLAIAPYLWPKDRSDLKVRVVAAMVALVLAKVITVVTPFTFKYAVDGLTAGKSDITVWALVLTPLFLIIAYGFGRVMMIVMTQVRDGLFARVGQNAVRNLATRTFIHMHRLSLRFHLERRTGGLTRVIERGTKGIDVILRFLLFNTFPTILELVLICVILAWNFGWAYAAIIAVTVTLYITFTFLLTEWRIGFRRDMNAADTEANTKAIDSLLNFETVKYFGNERHETERFEASMIQYEKAAVRTWTSLTVLNSGQSIIFTIGMTICMVMTAQEVRAGTASIGDFVLINSLLIQLYMPLNFLGSVYRDIKQGLVDVDAMFSLMDVEPDVVDAPDAGELVVSKGDIEFDHVSFAYDPVRPILKDVSFKVPAGSTTAIVGPSGAGKSTISRILYRFYDLGGGAIRIDGQDIARVTQESLRAAIGMVPQDTVLFNDTVRYNIGYGRPDASDSEVEDAAKMAQVHDFVRKLPEGYDAIVGERGLKLSGGEKQRVAIARTILKGPPILILDEATSALDTLTEQEIQSAINQVSKNRTTLVIAHRLSTVVDADEILVLVAGEVVERGTHGALLKKKGVYADMWNRQREADEARQILARNLKDGILPA